MITSLIGGIALTSWARTSMRYSAVALAVLLFLFSLRRFGERAGHAAERLESVERTYDVQRRMLEAAARRPHDRDDLTNRLRNGRF